MTKNKFTLQDIQDYLLELGFVWEDKTIYNPNTRHYKQAKLANFKQNVFLRMHQELTDRDVLMLGTINEETFELWFDHNKMVATSGWLEFLGNKKVCYDQ